MKYEHSFVSGEYKDCIFLGCDRIKTDTIKPENKMVPACCRLLLTALHQSTRKKASEKQ